MRLLILILITAQQASAAILPVDEQAFFRRAQVSYQAHDFDSYFGTAQWARLHLWSELNAGQKDKWLALELMALARHCQWQVASDLANEEDTLGPQSEKALSFVEMKAAYAHFKFDAKNSHGRLGPKLKRDRSQWASSPQEFSRLSTPEQLRVRVRSLCAE